MAIQTIDQLKTWFLTSLKPTQQQFHDWLDSYWHRNDKLPIGSVDKLSETLDNKADKVHVHSMGDVDGLDGKFNDQYLYFNNAVNDEITQRKEADEALQKEVDSLKKITCIRGNVDTWNDLLTLDSSGMREGDSYIVEADENRDGKSSLYVWSASNWVYTGEWAVGGSEKNLATTDLVQTDFARNYLVGRFGTLKFVFDRINSDGNQYGFKLAGGSGEHTELICENLNIESDMEINIKSKVTTLDSEHISIPQLAESLSLENKVITFDPFTKRIGYTDISSESEMSGENLATTDLEQTGNQRIYKVLDRRSTSSGELLFSLDASDPAGMQRGIAIGANGSEYVRINAEHIELNSVMRVADYDLFLENLPDMTFDPSAQILVRDPSGRVGTCKPNMQPEYIEHYPEIPEMFYIYPHQLNASYTAMCSYSKTVNFQYLPVGKVATIMIKNQGDHTITFQCDNMLVPTIGKIETAGEYTVTILKFSDDFVRCNIAKYE